MKRLGEVHMLFMLWNVHVFGHPKDHWTLQWKGLNLYSRNRVLKTASFEGSGYLGHNKLYIYLTLAHKILPTKPKRSEKRHVKMRKLWANCPYFCWLVLKRKGSEAHVFFPTKTPKTSRSLNFDEFFLLGGKSKVWVCQNSFTKQSRKHWIDHSSVGLCGLSAPMTVNCNEISALLSGVFDWKMATVWIKIFDLVKWHACKSDVGRSFAG